MPDLNFNVFRIKRTIQRDPIKQFLCFFVVGVLVPDLTINCDIGQHSQFLRCFLGPRGPLGAPSFVRPSARVQGLTGRVFQLRVGSGSGIGKNYRVGSGLGLGSGIGIIYWINRVLSGIEILDRVFPYFVIFNSLSTWLDIKFGIS